MVKINMEITEAVVWHLASVYKDDYDVVIDLEKSQFVISRELGLRKIVVKLVSGNIEVHCIKNNMMDHDRELWLLSGFWPSHLRFAQNAIFSCSLADPDSLDKAKDAIDQIIR